MTTLSVIEHQRLPIGDGPEAVLSEAQASALERLSPSLPPRALFWERRAVRPGAFCGVIRVGELTLEILPKLAGHEHDADGARRCLVAMLRRAGESLAIATGTADMALQRQHLLDILILDFCDRTNNLLRRGAIRRYIVEEGSLPVVRGRLHLPAQLRHDAANRARLFCRYDELSLDNDYNRALKCVLGLMLPLALGEAARRAVNNLLRRLEEVASVTVTADAVTALPFDRAIRHWQPVFQSMAWFLRGLHPDLTAGKAESLSLLFDMNRLFESFVAAVLRRAWAGSGCSVTAQGPQRYFAHDGDNDVVRMRPDVTVSAADGTTVLICDAKWKAAQAVTGDIYQMASYASRYRCLMVALLYPCGPELPGGTVRRFRLDDGRDTQILVCGLDLLALTKGLSPPPELGPAFIPMTSWPFKAVGSLDMSSFRSSIA
jgi:5-methylcytosine-specific restriction enzyme subunit McrC